MGFFSNPTRIPGLSRIRAEASPTMEVSGHLGIRQISVLISKDAKRQWRKENIADIGENM